MSMFSVVLFVHVAAVLGLVSALTLEAVVLHHVRHAATSGAVRSWIDRAPLPRWAAIAMLAVLLLSGGWLTGQMSMWGSGWPKFSLLGLAQLGVRSEERRVGKECRSRW